MVKIIYDSRRVTGTTKNFAVNLGKATGLEVMYVKDVPNDFKEDFILCTYTAGVGEVPVTTKEFLTKFGETMKAVVANGSSNFKAKGLFGVAGDRISNEYGVELLHKLDIGGTAEDVKYVARRVNFIFGINTEIEKNLKSMVKSTFKDGVFKLQRY